MGDGSCELGNGGWEIGDEDGTWEFGDGSGG